MGNCIGIKHCKRISYCNSVVTAKCCAASLKKTVLNIKLKPVLFHINCGIGLLFRNHIGMPLENYAGLVFIALCSGLFNYYVVGFIASIIKSSFFSKIAKIFSDFSAVSRAARDFREFFKKFKRRLCIAVLLKIKHKILP